METDFVRISQRMIQTRLAARTPDAKRAADEAFAHMFRMFGAGRFDEWRRSHLDFDGHDIDDSMAANPEADA